jgi:hypothetical protein
MSAKMRIFTFTAKTDVEHAQALSPSLHCSPNAGVEVCTIPIPIVLLGSKTGIFVFS